MPAQHITRSGQGIPTDIFTSENYELLCRQVAILHLLESYPTESLINSQATLRGLQLQMLQCSNQSCGYRTQCSI